jgi:hypothetical protein
MSDTTRRPSRAGSSGPSGSARAGSSGPSGSARAGRRERSRPTYRQQSFFARHRSRLLTAGVVAVIVLGVGFFVAGTLQKTYACSIISTPAPASPAASASTPVASPSTSASASGSAAASPSITLAPNQLGQSQPDMGNQHVTPNQVPIRYTYCPPASGNHYNIANRGPIQPRFYGPDDGTEPMGWVHNLEHGALVVLYSCNGGCPDDATLQRLKDFYSTFPPSPVCGIPRGRISPVITRFDEMSTKYAALVWDRLLMQDTLDTGAMLRFYLAEGEQNNPEPQCNPASPSAAPSASPSGSASPAGSASPSAGSSPSANPSSSAAAPSPS